MKIAVTGATGQLGRIVVAQLAEKIGAGNVIALVRNRDKAQDLGVEVRLGDYNQPEQMAESLQGVDKVLLISSSNSLDKRFGDHLNALKAIKQAGVKHLVYTSFQRADTSKVIVAMGHPETEQAIKETGIPYTILRNAWYHQNNAQFIRQAVKNGVYYGSGKDGRISSADRKDYAEGAVVVLTSEGHENQTYELAGDVSYTLADLAQVIGVPYVEVAKADYDQPAPAHIGGKLGDWVAFWDENVANGDAYSEDKTLVELIGRPITPLSDSVKALLSE